MILQASLIVRTVFKLGERREKLHHDISGSSVALFGDDTFRILNRLFIFHYFAVAV